jgi:hypothetical protein
MGKVSLTRRSALGKILKTAAVAAGMTVADLRGFQRQVTKAASAKLKVLKFKLSGYNKSVFESEFGRSTPHVPLQNIPGLKNLANKLIKPGQTLPGGNLMGCQTNFGNMGGSFGASGVCPALDGCVWNSSSCPNMGECSGVNICSGQDIGGGGGGGTGPDSCTGVNDCNGQSCSTLTSCGDNECGGQTCPSFTNCGSNKQSIAGGGDCGSATGLTETLNQFRTDPYVQGLFKQFNVTTVEQLATQLNSMLKQRRVVMPSQVIK